jgi:hypothetical protein
VQFTRDNHGIGNALAKIQVHSQHALLDTPHAEEMSHMCFGQSVTLSFGGLFATHPPLNERIQALGFSPEVLVRSIGNKIKNEKAAAEAERAKTEAPSGEEKLQKMVGGAAAVIATVGTLNDTHLRYAEQLHNAIPPALLAAAHDRLQAPALLFALAIVESPSVETIALMHVERRMGKDTARVLSSLLLACKTLPAAQRLALLNAMRAALEFMNKDQRELCVTTLREVVKLDQTITAFEYVLTSLAQSWLQPKSVYTGASIKRFGDVADELALVVAMVVRAGRSNAEVMEQHYQQTMKTFAVPVRSRTSQFDAEQLHAALCKLDGLLPMLKRPLIQALADVIMVDGTVTTDETELLRAIAEHLNCPMPPLAA